MDSVAESLDETLPLDEAGCSSSSVSKLVKTKGHKNIMTSRLASALYNAKLSDGMATHVLVAAAEAFGQRAEDLSISRSTIQRARQENRLKESYEISTGFVDDVI